MDEQTTDQPPEPSIYEQMYRQLHAYHFGAIGFLDLLDCFEQILRVKPPSDQTELMDGDLSA
jgi:hypothetical protein